MGFLLVHCGIIITDTFFQPEWPPQHLCKKKKSYAWEEADKGSQTGRKERQNLIKFNKAERIAQAVNSDSAFFSFTTRAYLNTFTPPPFICVCIHWERNSWTQRETLTSFFLFECWPRMATICANCLTLWLSCISSHKYQTALHFSDNTHIAIHRLCSVLPLFRLLSLCSSKLTQTEVVCHLQPTEISV